MRVISLLLCLTDASLALRVVRTPSQAHRFSVSQGLSRADVLKLASGLAVGVPVAANAVAIDDDDMDEDDEIPDVRSGRPAKKKTKSVGKVDAAQAVAAVSEIKAARSGLDKLDERLRKADYKGAAGLLGEPPFVNLEQNLLTVVASPTLGPDEKKAIGTIKRYGVGADALIMVGGLEAAVNKENGSGAADYSSKAKAALNEIELLCKAIK